MRENNAVSQIGFFAFIIRKNNSRHNIYGVVLKEPPAAGKVVSLKGDDHNGDYRIVQIEEYQAREAYFHIQVERIEKENPNEVLRLASLVTALCR